MPGLQDTKQPHPLFSVHGLNGEAQEGQSETSHGSHGSREAGAKDQYETLPEVKTGEMRSVLLWAALASLSWAPHLQEAGKLQDHGPGERAGTHCWSFPTTGEEAATVARSQVTSLG